MTRTPSSSGRLQVEQLEGREVPAILFGVTPANQLVTFDSANPNVLLDSTTITGLLSFGEVISDIDVRTATGGLYGHSDLGRLYQINPVSGFAVPVGTPVALSAVYRGFDFDPRADRIRILTNQGQNLIREPVFGLFVRAATPLSYAPGDVSQGVAPRVTGAAFFNNVPDATFRVLFGLDHSRNALVRVGRTSLDDGLLTTIGGLGLDVTPRVGLDIAPVSNVMFASLQVAGQSVSRLYTISYATGRANLVGPIGGGLLLNDIAVDLRGISGFTSAAGFGAFAAPTPTGFGSGFTVGFGSFGTGFTAGFNTGTGTFGFNTAAFPALSSPLGAPITTTGLLPTAQPFPTVTQPFPATTPFPTATPIPAALTAPFFGSTTTTAGAANF